MSPLWMWLALGAVGVFFSGLFSGAETAAYRYNRARHRLLLAEGSARARLVQRLTGDVPAFLVVCLIGTNLANALVSFVSTLAIEQLGTGRPELWSTLTVAPLLFILGELAPKDLFRRHADQLLYRTAPLLRLAALALSPLARLLRLLPLLLQRLGLRAEDSGVLPAEERLRQAIAAGSEEGTLTAYQATLARNIFALRALAVEQVMVPLARIDALEAATPLEEARERVRRLGHTRYPVFRDRPWNVVGLVTLYDLLFEERPGLTIRGYVQPVLTLPPGERVTAALLRMRQARSTLAVVTRDGRALGIVTLKDLVEEITGELRDL